MPLRSHKFSVMHLPEVIFSFKPYKVLLALGYLVVAIGMDSNYQKFHSLDLLMAALVLHLVTVLTFFSGTILITRKHVIFVMNFAVKVKKKIDIARFELDTYSWWVQRLRLVAVLQNGKRMVITDVNKVAGNDNDTHPERTAVRLNQQIAPI